MITLFLSSELKLSLQEIGTYGSARGIGAILGASLAGWTALRVGRKWTAFISVLLLGCACAAMSFATDTKSATVLGIVWGVAWSYQETIFVILAMALAQGAFAATIFALLMMFSNIGTSIGEASMTPLSQAHGFHWLFQTSGACFAILLPILGLTFRFIPAFSREADTRPTSGEA